MTHLIVRKGIGKCSNCGANYSPEDWVRKKTCYVCGKTLEYLEANESNGIDWVKFILILLVASLFGLVLYSLRKLF